jgi:hypothetical protein
MLQRYQRDANDDQRINPRENHHFIFCHFNKKYKISKEIFKLNSFDHIAINQGRVETGLM